MKGYAVFFPLALFFCSLPLVLLAQPRGCVRGLGGAPVPHANLIVFDSQDKIFSFTSTNSEGRFAFSKVGDYGGKQLRVTSLNHQPLQMLISSSDTLLNITLLEESKILREVVVSAKPIREYNDTTQYLVSAFADGMEKNVEDMLRKLPGVQVSEDGSISVRGKTISKITLDNVDMFGENYKTVSRTMPAKFVGTVEIIKNYQENRHLRDVQQSDKLILNLSLRSDMRLQRPVGQVSLGGGWRNRYDLSGNMLVMNKKLKLYDATTFSNVSPLRISSYEDAGRTDSVSPVGNHLNSLASHDDILFTE